jgi:hypothetical protein
VFDVSLNVNGLSELAMLVTLPRNSSVVNDLRELSMFLAKSSNTSIFSQINRDGVPGKIDCK